ncbi:MAG: hypothetical protein AB1555_13590 [Nitrospirota bacterium]
MTDMSSVIDASLALMGAAAVLATGIWTLSSSQSTTVSTTEVQREAGAPAQALRKAA